MIWVQRWLAAGVGWLGRRLRRLIRPLAELELRLDLAGRTCEVCRRPAVSAYFRVRHGELVKRFLCARHQEKRL